MIMKMLEWFNYFTPLLLFAIDNTFEYNEIIEYLFFSF